jgi:hypothetical protein
MARRQLAGLLKQLIGLVRRRTSRKERSIAFVVRTVRQSASGQPRKANNASRSRSRHSTALGITSRHWQAHLLKRALASRCVGAW